MPAATTGPVVLTEDACWTLLSRARMGRLATSTEEGPDIFPVNFLVHERTLLFRSAPGTKLVEIAARPQIALEIDGRRRGRFWSVVVRGVARRLEDDAEIEATGVLGLKSWGPTDRFNYVRIEPRSVTGRWFRRPWWLSTARDAT